MSWIWAALMPHPPIIVPAVGRGREQEAAITLKGIEDLCSRLSEQPGAKPDLLLVLSPHEPYAPGALFLNSAPIPRGDLSPFGAPEVALELHTSGEALEALAAHIESHGITVATGAAGDLTRDHGALVPLHFLASCFGGALPPVILGSPIGLSPQGALALGKALADFEPGYRCALLASGDLSHRLKPDGPNGYHPDGQVLDEAVVRALREGDPSILTSLPERTLHNAGECGLRSVMTLLGLSGGKDITVFSYEGPFGVGYCNALWLPGASSAALSCTEGASQNAPAFQGRHPFPCLARETVRRHLTGISATDALLEEICAGEGLWGEEKACFVSIKTKRGDLRGCIGTILPVRPNLKQEIMANAVSAATQDPRFPPMTANELDKVIFSVDVLTTPEVVASTAELDPAVWGVIVSKGNRRGLLLPDLPGVTSVGQQIAIAAQKAGISDLEGVRLERFRVERYPEE